MKARRERMPRVSEGNMKLIAGDLGKEVVTRSAGGLGFGQ